LGPAQVQMNICAIDEPISSVGQAFPLAAADRNACKATTASSMSAGSLSGGKAFPAGAMRDGIGIRNFKTALLQVVAEIED